MGKELNLFSFRNVIPMNTFKFQMLLLKVSSLVVRKVMISSRILTHLF